MVFVQDQIIEPTKKIFKIDQEIKNRNDSFKQKIAKLQNMTYKSTVNCNLFPTSCFTNSDCQNRCSNDTDAYICSNKNLCVPLRDRAPVSVGKCNPRHGILALLLADTQMHVANWKCLSLYGDYFKDNDTVSEGVCEHGSLNVNINFKSPSMVDCTCPEGYDLISLKNSDSVEMVSTEIPRCIQNKFLYSPNDIIDVSIK
jgi:hypothetical protein